MIVKRETRWRVTSGIPTTELASRLNRLELDGWSVFQITQSTYDRYTVISNRRVRVRDE